MEYDTANHYQILEKDNTFSVLIYLCFLYWGRSRAHAIGQWPSGLRLCNHIGRNPGQTPTSARSGLEMQPQYGAPNDL